MGAFGIVLWPLARLAEARGRLFPFVPVLIGCGAGAWFALPTEPARGFYGIMVMVALLSAGIAARGPELARPLAVALFCLCLGPLAGGARLHVVAAPMLERAYYGPVQGRIVMMDRSQTDALRLTLDQVYLPGVAPQDTPVRVRLSLRASREWLDPRPGQVVMATARLAAPQGAVEPGGFDFRQMAFFARLGAVGYTTAPVVLWAEPLPRAQIVPRIRTHLSTAIRAAIPGDAGAFAAGVMTGDRSGLSLGAVQDLRDSSLAHLLAISGMNLAFLIGFVFALLRGGIALVPPVALRVDGKKIAALVSLPVAFFYLLLSGANVATERAFIMVAVMLCAVLLDRAAVTLRSVAIAGTVIVIWKPEALTDPGFQMSFAATVALIAGFEWLTKVMDRRALPRFLPALVTFVMSSVIGGFATAPYAAAHFNRFTDFGLLANLLTVTVMGTVVMPAGAVAALLAPFGLAAPALWVMGQGARWILYVADRIAALDGAVTGIPAAPGGALALLTLGAAWLIVWPFRARWAGLVPMVAALAIWVQAERPLVLVNENARLAGVMSAEGRSLSRGRGEGFTATNWLENDGDLTGQDRAAQRPGFRTVPEGQVFTFAGRSGLLLADAADPAVACARYDLVIAGADADAGGGCRYIGPATLSRTGTLAVTIKQDELHFVPTRAAQRMWSAPQTGGLDLAPIQ